MTQAIPVSQIVTVNPAVVGAGGNPLSLNSIFIDNSTGVTVSSLLSFSSLAEVTEYFGAGSTQEALANHYFLGYDGSTKKPGTLFFAGYAAADRAAWLRGTSLAGMTLTDLKAISGTLAVTVDGSAKSGTVSLSAATSFTNAATLITSALSLSGGAAVTWNSTASRFIVTSGTTGASSTITQCTGTAAAALGLSAGTLSQGIVADTPAVAMARIAPMSQNWAAFMTTWEPSNADKEAFAVWTNSQAGRYVYVCDDIDAGYATPNNALMFGSIVDAANYEGVCVVYGHPHVAAFVCGYIGSVDYQAVNGRATPAFKTQSGMDVTVTTSALATAVLSNNASYFGQYAAPGNGNTYNIFYDGRMGGSKFKWLDTYINQVYLNAQLQLSIFNGLQQVSAAPYNSRGETFIRAWCADPIAEALNNGSIQTGVQLSALQKATIASQAGLDISSQLEGQGYYLQILPASAQVRQARQSPPVKLWYCDGGAIQQITLNSIAVL